MATIVTRAGKGSPLTNAEVDANFTNLNNQLATALFGANNLSDLANVSTARSNLGVAIGTNVQAWDADLDAIAALAGTSGFLKKTAANTWALDTSTYLTGITSSQVTTALGYTPINSSAIGSTVQAWDADLDAIAAIAGTSGLLKKTAANTWALDTSAYLTGITSSQVTTALGYTPPTPTGGGASGTWGVNISGTASVATNVTIVSDTTTATTQFLGFYAGTSGNGTPKAASGLTYTPSTGLFATTKATFTPNAQGVSTGLTVVNGDITTYRSGGTTGVIYLDNTGSHYLYFDGTNYNLNAGNLICTGNVTAYSDETLKTNWRALAPDFIEQLAELQSGTYDRLDEEITQVGVSAQGLQKFMQHAVQCNDSGILSVAYGNAALVSAVELARELVALKKYVKSKLG